MLDERCACKTRSVPRTPIERMNLIHRLIFAGLLGLLLSGCGSPSSESPEQGLQAIIELYEARDFDALIRTRYAEIGKANGEPQVLNLIARFEAAFAGEQDLARAVATFETALQSAPELQENGSVAVFQLEGEFCKLSRMTDGRWGFHL